jgi:hypothetical protein
MNMHMTVPEGSTKIDMLAERYRAAFTKLEGGRAQWIEGTLELAVVVAEARIDYPDHRAFSHWLSHHGLEHLHPNDCMALKGFSRDLQAARKMLEESKSTSWRTIWEKQPKRTLTKNGKGPLSHQSGSSKRKRAAVIPYVMRDDYVPGARPPASDPPRSFQRRERAPVHNPPPPVRKGVNLKSLTREQVDPDFKGTHLEFVTKYGHVNLHTKEQIEHNKRQEELMAWLGTVSDHERTARAMLAATVDPATLREWMSKSATKAEKMQAWRDSIKRACESLLAADHDQKSAP